MQKCKQKPRTVGVGAEAVAVLDTPFHSVSVPYFFLLIILYLKLYEIYQSIQFCFIVSFGQCFPIQFLYSHSSFNIKLPLPLNMFSRIKAISFFLGCKMIRILQFFLKKKNQMVMIGTTNNSFKSDTHIPKREPKHRNVHIKHNIFETNEQNARRMNRKIYDIINYLLSECVI